MNDRVRRALAAAALCIAAVAALTACGPGSGGTGTGAPEEFSAPATIPGAGTTGGSAHGGQPDAQLTIRAGAIELHASCGRIVFDAQAAELAADVSLAGTLTNAGTTTRGSVHLQFDAAPDSSTEVTITLLDASGQVVVGPMVLQRQQTSSVPACQ